jgi:phosphatidylglycerophosphate synthase
MPPSTSPPARAVVNPANALTALRLAAAPALVAALRTQAAWLALALFALAVATDLLDGRVARRRGEASATGGLLDHATDATFVALGLGALAMRGEVPALLPWLVGAAFLQYALDSRALAGRPLRTSGLGRANGIAYFVLLGTPLVRDALGLAFPGSGLVEGLGWLLVASSLVSMADRALAHGRPRRSAARRAGAGERG